MAYKPVWYFQRTKCTTTLSSNFTIYKIEYKILFDPKMLQKICDEYYF